MLTQLGCCGQSKLTLRQVNCVSQHDATALLLQDLWRLSSEHSCVILSHISQRSLDLKQTTAKAELAKEMVMHFKSVLPEDAEAYLSQHGWELQHSALLVEECRRCGLKLFGDLDVTDERLVENEDHKVMQAIHSEDHIEAQKYTASRLGLAKTRPLLTSTLGSRPM